MSTLVETEDRPVCLPGRTNELRFPQIETAFGIPKVHAASNGSRHTSINNMNYCNSNNQNNSSKERSHASNKSYSVNRELDSHHLVPQASNLLKFPGIHLPRSSSFVCLANDGKQISSRDTTSEDHSKFKSPSCLLRYGEREDESLTFHSQSEPRNEAMYSNNPVSILPGTESKSGVKFPSIFSHHKEYSLKLPCSLNTSNNMTSMNQGVNSFSIRINQPFCGRPGRDGLYTKMKTKMLPDPGDNHVQKSSHPSPLLLPISTTLGCASRHRGQKKRKTKRSDS